MFLGASGLDLWPLSSTSCDLRILCVLRSSRCSCSCVRLQFPRTASGPGTRAWPWTCSLCSRDGWKLEGLTACSTQMWVAVLLWSRLLRVESLIAEVAASDSFGKLWKMTYFAYIFLLLLVNIFFPAHELSYFIFFFLIPYWRFLLQTCFVVFSFFSSVRRSIFVYLLPDIILSRLQFFFVEMLFEEIQVSCLGLLARASASCTLSTKQYRKK